MNYIQSNITTICVGTFYGVFRISWGTKGSRVALPHSRIMIHQPEGGSQGQATLYYQNQKKF
jgi:ATP-dependent Clp protease protease subunit